MYIQKDSIEKAVQRLVDDHGTIRRIYIKESNNPVGFVIRKELSVGADTADVLFNISFNPMYGRKYFTPNEYKFFAIQRTDKVRDLIKDCDFEIELNKHDDKMLADYVMNYIRDVDCQCDEGELGNDLVYLESWIRHEIMKSVKYYNGRRVIAHFVANI